MGAVSWKKIILHMADFVFINVNALKRKSAWKSFFLGRNSSLFGCGSEIIFFLAPHTRRLWMGQMAHLIDQWNCILANVKSHAVFFLLILQNGDAKFSDAFRGVTENNRFVTVVLLLISDWGKPRKRYFDAQKVQRTKRRNFTEDVFSIYVDSWCFEAVIFCSVYENRFG